MNINKCAVPCATRHLPNFEVPAHGRSLQVDEQAGRFALQFHRSGREAEARGSRVAGQTVTQQMGRTRTSPTLFQSPSHCARGLAGSSQKSGAITFQIPFHPEDAHPPSLPVYPIPIDVSQMDLSPKCPPPSACHRLEFPPLNVTPLANELDFTMQGNVFQYCS